MQLEDVAWKNVKDAPGVVETTMESWRDFLDLANGDAFELERHLFRGQTTPWVLFPSLVRGQRAAEQKMSMNSPGTLDMVHAMFFPEYRRARCLERFKQACRGHLPLDDGAPENEWWAYGRHVGLRTPLLDLTLSSLRCPLLRVRRTEERGL